MLTKDLFTSDNFDPGLVEAVGNRLANGAYADSVLAGMRFLTDRLRQISGAEGDGANLTGLVLGGNAPLFRLNALQTASEKDEQKGIEQYIRGLYVGIRNPRAHEAVQDTEAFAMKALVSIDLALHYLARESQAFDVEAFVNRIFEPHFVPSAEYAQALVANIPAAEVLPVFLRAFERRGEGEGDRSRFAFVAMYQLMSQDDMRNATRAIGDALRAENDTGRIAEMFRLMKPEAWSFLQDDVRMRMENIIIEACRQGTYDVHSGVTHHGIGSWGNTFGRYFVRSGDLAQVIMGKLNVSWYTQNYVGKYYMYTMPAVVPAERITAAAEGVAYAALGNKAHVVRTKLLEVAANYPESWKAALRVAVQERKESDVEYANTLLGALGPATP